MQNKGILMVISGFSGAGKGTLVKNLKKILQKTDLSSMLSIAAIITEHRKHMWKSRCRQARM